jgi:hypothetical protein
VIDVATILPGGIRGRGWRYAERLASHLLESSRQVNLRFSTTGTRASTAGGTARCRR